jgi:hypothetical protein
MNIQTVLAQVTDYANALESAAIWHNSKESIDRVKHKLKISNGDDYIYEFYCYVRVLSDLTHNYTVRFVPGTGKNRMNFPQGPSNKKGRPLFILQDKTTGEPLYQVCSGTNIMTMFPPMTAAPDISFQKHDASDNPTYNDVVLLFDAKYNRAGSAKVKVSQGQLGEVTNMITHLQLATTPSVVLNFVSLAGFIRNCLLTNGNAHSDNKAQHDYFNLSEVEGFTVSQAFKIVP